MDFMRYCSQVVHKFIFFCMSMLYFFRNFAFIIFINNRENERNYSYGVRPCRI